MRQDKSGDEVSADTEVKMEHVTRLLKLQRTRQSSRNRKVAPRVSRMPESQGQPPKGNSLFPDQKFKLHGQGMTGSFREYTHLCDEYKMLPEGDYWQQHQNWTCSDVTDAELRSKLMHLRKKNHNLGSSSVQVLKGMLRSFLLIAPSRFESTQTY